MKLPPPAISNRAYTFVEIMIVLGILALITAIAVPNLLRSRQRAQQQLCIENLRKIEGVKQQWATEQKKSLSDVPIQQDLEVYLKVWPVCPSSGSYTPNEVGSLATCSQPGHTL